MCWSRNKEENRIRLNLEKEQGPVYVGPGGHIPNKQNSESGKNQRHRHTEARFQQYPHIVNRIGKCKQRMEMIW